MKNKLEFVEVIIVTNELGKEVFTKEGKLLASIKKPKKVDEVLSYNTVAKRLDTVIRTHNISASALAKKAGIPQGAMSVMRNAKSTMSRKNAIRMQEAGFGDAKSWLNLKIK